MSKTLSIYSIKDLEVLSGIKAHTLRIWEQRYNLLSPKRTDTNIRFYDDEDVKLILNISLLNQHGIKISRIAQMSQEEMYAQVLSLTETNLKFPEQVHNLVLCMLDLDEGRFERIMFKNTQEFGFEQTMLNIIYPFLSKIGFLWQTGAISPSHEHFISNLIRQKTISAIDSVKFNTDVNGKKFLLFLPESEYHELSLLFCHYILKSRSNYVAYFGQSLPLEDVAVAHDIVQPDYIFTVLTASLTDYNVEEYLKKIAQKFPHTQILITGYQVVGSDIEYPDNVTVLTKFEQIIDYAEISKL